MKLLKKSKQVICARFVLPLYQAWTGPQGRREVSLWAGRIADEQSTGEKRLQSKYKTKFTLEMLCDKKSNHKSVGNKKQASYYIYQCERTFNILKYIKNHLRNRLRDDHVDALNAMNENKDLLMVIDNEVVIKKMCKGKS